MSDLLPRTARGKRPAFHENSAIDRLITIVMALTSEVSVLRDRVDTMELLGNKSGWLEHGAVDGFVADHPTRERREVAREAYLGRVLHALRAEIDGLEQEDDYWASISEIEAEQDDAHRKQV